MSLPENEAWFPAKRYGYGWGFPRRWQGLLVLVGYFLGLLLPAFSLSTPRRTVAYLVYLIVLTLAVMAVCMWKGEKPRWRWGDHEEP